MHCHGFARHCVVIGQSPNHAPNQNPMQAGNATFDHRLLISTAFLVAVNLLPLAGVLFFGWSVYQIVLLFWAENLVIGLFTIARMVTLLRRTGEKKVLLLAPFFCVHFGGFSLVHLVFVMALFRPDEPVGTGMSLWIPFLALLLSHGISYVANFLGKHEYRGYSGEEVMMAPYSQVLILHCTIIGGGFIVQLLGEPVYALALLVVLKIAIDVITHAREHRQRQIADPLRKKAGREDGDVFRPWDQPQQEEPNDR